LGGSVHQENGGGMGHDHQEIKERKEWWQAKESKKKKATGKKAGGGNILERRPFPCRGIQKNGRQSGRQGRVGKGSIVNTKQAGTRREGRPPAGTFERKRGTEGGDRRKQKKATSGCWPLREKKKRDELKRRTKVGEVEREECMAGGGEKYRRKLSVQAYLRTPYTLPTGEKKRNKPVSINPKEITRGRGSPEKNTGKEKAGKKESDTEVRSKSWFPRDHTVCSISCKVRCG